MDFPWPAPALPIGTVREALERAMATVGVATGMVATGRPVDLAGLDTLAGAVCAQVLDLPPAHGARFRPALAELNAKIAALSTAMSQRLNGATP